MTTVWQNFLQSAKSKKRCMACDRGIHGDEAGDIEAYVRRPLLQIISDCADDDTPSSLPLA